MRKIGEIHLRLCITILPPWEHTRLVHVQSYIVPVVLMGFDIFLVLRRSKEILGFFPQKCCNLKRENVSVCVCVCIFLIFFLFLFCYWPTIDCLK